MITAIIWLFNNDDHRCLLTKHTGEFISKILAAFFAMCVPTIFHSGYYCDNSLAPVSDLGNFTCPIGHYCPNGTLRSTEFPCQPGTYNNLTGLDTASNCQECPPGFYCQNPGLSEPQGPCMAGYVSIACRCERVVLKMPLR